MQTPNTQTTTTQQTQGQPAAQTAEPATVGSSALSFDELESLHAETDRNTSTQPAKDSKSTDGSADDSSADGADGSKEASGKKKNPLEKAVDQKAKGAKVIKIQNGEEITELAPEAEVEVTVDGKIEKVSIQELRNQFSGKVQYDKKFSELAKDKRAFENERKGLYSSVDEIKSKFAAKDSKGAIAALAETLGADPIEVWGTLENFVISELAKFDGLSESEIRAKRAEEENNWRKSRESERAKRDQTQKESAQHEEALKKTLESHSLTEDEFFDAYDDLKATGKLPADKIDADAVIGYKLGMAARESIESQISEMGIELDNAAIGELIEIQVVNKFTADDMKDIIAQVHGSKKKPKGSALARKVQTGSRHSTATGTPAKTKTEPLFFDDLEA